MFPFVLGHLRKLLKARNRHNLVIVYMISKVDFNIDYKEGAMIYENIILNVILTYFKNDFLSIPKN